MRRRNAAFARRVVERYRSVGLVATVDLLLALERSFWPTFTVSVGDRSLSGVPRLESLVELGDNGPPGIEIDDQDLYQI